MKKLIISLLLIFSCKIYAQIFPEGIPFQAQIIGSDGGFLSNQTVDIRFNLRADNTSGTIVWQENHIILLNAYSHFSAVVGTGVSSGAGSAAQFSEIDWSTGIYFLELLVDEAMIGNYISISNEQLMSVPFAFHSKTTSQQFALSSLSDVDTSGIQPGFVLKWDGTKWIPQPDVQDVDTVSYSFNSFQADYADTASYALNCIQSDIWADSANFSFESLNSQYADSAQYAFYSQNANYALLADTANYSSGNWGLYGNNGTVPSSNFIGTIDSTDLVFKSYNIERMRIKGNGSIGIGTTSPLCEFHLENTDGVLFTGTFGAGSIPAQGAGTRMMFYPGKSAFRAGYVSSTNWDNVYTGQYSFAGGYNTRASGMYSVAFGLNSIASGDYSFVAGKGGLATGDYTMVAGENSQASGDYGVALGRAGDASGYGSVAIGYHTTALGDYALSLGNYTTVTGNNGVAMGYHAESLHDGSFVFSDQSLLSGVTQTTAPNQFMVKASGGVIFYTNSSITTGVTLAPGAGAWSTLSDRNQKENISTINYSDYLKRLDSLEIYKWKYISQDSSIYHIGPMAQDFYHAFDLGNDPTTINSGDFDGINMVLLKALYEKMEIIDLQQKKILSMEQDLENLRIRRESLENSILELEMKIENETANP